MKRNLLKSTALKRIAAALLCTSMAFGLAACQPAETTPQGGDAQTEGEGEGEGVPTGEGSHLNIGLVGTPYSLANWLSNDMVVSLLMSAINPRLVTIGEDGSKELVILKDVQQSEDLKTVTWTIHEGLSWHDGVPFTVNDIGFSMDYQVEHGLGHGATYYAGVESWKALDDYTLEIQLKDPLVNFTNQAAYWPVVMPEHIYKDVEDPANFDYNGLGYGPYKLVEYEPGQYYYCEKVPNWPLANDGQGAFIDSITYRIYEDANSMTLALLNGEIDVCGSSINVAAQNQIKQNEGYTVLNSMSLGYGYLGFNYNNEFLADNNVRLAIAHVIDREAMVNTARSGGAVPMYWPVSPAYPDLITSDIRFPELDVEKGNQILEEAGYVDTNGDGIREKDGKDMALTLTCRSSTLDVDACASVLKANIETLGIKVTTEILESATYVDKVTKQKTHDMNYIEWGTIDDPDMSLQLYQTDSHLNFYNFSDPLMDELVDKMETEPDYEQRKVLLDQFQEEFIKELPCVDILVSTSGWGCSNKFEGWDVTPGNYGPVELKHLVKVKPVAE